MVVMYKKQKGSSINHFINKHVFSEFVRVLESRVTLVK